ncbi:hypothetical protein [Desulfovibrio sp. JC010]|uniref:hypothetical protein n=1 Tax=Desulfovibrio sp. JC010 TaxID=2593641 RepID=UPI0013D1D45E|nr:hypothetical protein [Desulfovibrio sp. JC010]NDV28043.1 hypothetical protein [Desulfovibrio sp. JC010]
MSNFIQIGWKYSKPWLFPLAVACIYGLCQLYDPESTARSIKVCKALFTQLGLPICIVLVMMTLINRYLDPATVARFLGSKTGIRGVFLSGLAGIISMGPIYAWYPLFKSLKEKGASTFIIANFIGCRSVKPVLLPVLLAYFGWQFSTVFVLINLFGAMGTAYLVGVVCPNTKVD